MPLVWLFKSESDSNNDYQSSLEEIGYTCVCIPTLEFVFINQNAIQDSLKNPDQFSGMVFTSGKAVDAVSNLYCNLPVNVHKSWNSKQIFSVGKVTQELIMKTMCLTSIGSEAGNAVQLADIIIKETKPFDKPILFPCGNMKRDELPSLLAKNDRDFRAITCYETKVHCKLEVRLNELINAASPDFCVFFSPSGVQFVCPLLQKSKLNLSKIKFIALGPTTNAAIVQQKIPVFGICSQPSPSALASLLKSSL